MAAAKGGWSVCDPVLRLAGAAYGGSEETSTTVCGDEGMCVVCNLRKAGCSLIAYCCTTVCGDEGRCVVSNLRKAGCSLVADCCTTVCGYEIRCVVCNLRKAGCSLIADCCTTVCSDEGRCVVRNLRKAACSRIADCCTTVCGAGGRCVVCNLPKAGCSLNADCCDGDRHEIKRDSRWLEIGVAEVPSVWPARSYCAKLHGAIPSGIRWGAGAFFCRAPAAPNTASSAQGQQPGSSWCWRGGIFRG